MQLGSKVKVIELLDFEKEIGIKIGSIGIVKKIYTCDCLNDVLFKEKIDEDCPNLNKDGTYKMFKFQLEKVVE